MVTDDDFGLAAFDNAGYGPAIVDLVRYAASLHLACREIEGGCDPAQAVTAYFDAYRTALDHPVSRTEPAIVARLRARLGPEPEAWLQWADGLMQALPRAEDERVRREWFRFVALMRETNPARPESFYRIHRLGAVEIGLGSAVERKMLIRIAGAADDPRDDLILEARYHSLPEYRGCLSLSDVRGQADLNALATDAGTQLAGHFWQTSPEALRGHQRFTQLRAFELTEQRARELARSLAREVIAEWNRFRGQDVRN